MKTRTIRMFEFYMVTLPGGAVETGETLEKAVIRKERGNLV